MQPEWFFIENPQTGYLKARPVIQGMPWQDVDYCKYGCKFLEERNLRKSAKVPPASLFGGFGICANKTVQSPPLGSFGEQ
eukprot:15436107-Alexandrium_andersonii.AAC.1